MQIKCIALDLDRTTLNSQGKLSEKTKAALELAIASGIEVVVASGRALNSLPADVLAIDGIRYAITSNGAAVYELKTGQCLQQYKMTECSVLDILRLMEEEQVAYEAFIDGKPYGQKEYVEDPVRYGATPKAVPYVQSTREPVADFKSFLYEHRRELDSLDLVVRDEETKQRLWKILQEQVADLYITSSIVQLLEISYRECGKHSGARFILEHLGFQREELAAFGDGDNDIDLLKYAGLGCAVANATENCRMAADCIVLSNDEDGVAEEILRIIEDNKQKNP